MSTRATYTFSNTALAGEDVTVYIHHDGYPMGAAEYFRKAMDEKLDSGRQLLEAFIAANDRAMITRCHQAHGDTDYRYTTDGKQITVEHRKIEFTDDGYKEVWSTMYHGDIDEFIISQMHKQEAVA